MLRNFDYSTGQLLLEKRLRTPHEGHLLDPGDVGVGTAIAFMEEFQDVVVLTSGHSVQRVGETGKVHWIWASPDKT